MMVSIIEQYGYLMTPEYRALNESRERQRNNSYIEQRFQQMKKEVIAELKPFIEQAASKSIEIKVQNNTTPALQELDKTIKNLGNL